jgi:hypothetical protein
MAKAEERGFEESETFGSSGMLPTETGTKGALSPPFWMFPLAL